MTKKYFLTKFFQVNFRKSHEILDEFLKSIKHYIKMFEAAGLLAPPPLPPPPPALVGLKDRKGITIINAFQKTFKNVNGKSNKIWVNKGSEI